MEHDAEPTAPLPERDCPNEGCPCRTLDYAAASWRAAAEAVRRMDEAGRVIQLSPPRPQRW